MTNPKIFLPEIQLYRLVTALLDYVRNDLQINSSLPKESYLYKLFCDESYDKYNLFNQGREILAKATQNKRLLEVCIGYNMQRQSAPTIHIIIPSGTKGQTDGIGFGQGENDDFTGSKGTRISKARSFLANYSLLVSSDNMGDVLFIHHLLQSLIIGGHEQLDIAGFENIQLSMQDITLQQDLIPMNMFHRIIGLTFNYETVVPSIDLTEAIKTIQWTSSPIIEIGKIVL